MKRTDLPISHKVRVRMQFTATPAPDGKAVGLTVDKKLTILKVLLQERHGDQGVRTYEDWLLLAASQQCKDETGGPSAA